MGTETESREASLARNAAWLCIRYLAVTVAGLYASRVVLGALGVTDYGIYAVVGSVVAAFDFLNTTLAGATSRFLAFELGRGGNVKAQLSAAITAHGAVAAIVFIAAETAGLWFTETYLDIPAESRTAARWAYQAAIVAAVATVMQIPLTALLIAHERMKTYARIEMAQSALKLAAAVALSETGGQLAVYAWMMAGVPAITAVAYTASCRRLFRDDCAWERPRRATLLPMLRFSAIDLYGNLCVSGRNRGVEWLINIFHGVAYNAAAAVANIVNNAILGIATTVTTAFRPRVIKLYASGDYTEMMRILSRAMVASGSIMAIAGGPCLLETETLLGLWLGEAPAGAADFARLLIAQSFAGLAIAVLSIAIHATGRIKGLSMINGTIYLSTVAAAWLAYRNGANVDAAYAASAALTLIAVVTTVIMARKLIPSGGWGRIVMKTIIMWAIAGACCVPAWQAGTMIEPGIARLAAVTAIYAACYCACAWPTLLDNEDRRAIVKKATGR